MEEDKRSFGELLRNCRELSRKSGELLVIGKDNDDLLREIDKLDRILMKKYLSREEYL